MSIQLPQIDGAAAPVDNDEAPVDIAVADAPAAKAFVQTSPRAAPASQYRLQRDDRFWNIRAVTLNDFVNLPDHDYEIILDLNLLPSLASSITIKMKDRFEISVSGNNILLTQSRDGLTIGRGTNFTVDASGLWAIGTATVPPSTIPTGRYFLYLLDDVPNTRHSNARKLGENGPCIQVHIEYFDNNHQLSAEHFPTIGTNVVPKDTPMEDVWLQTDEGDADEGRRR